MRRLFFRSFSSLVNEPPGSPINYYLNSHKNNSFPLLSSYLRKNIVKSLESSFREKSKQNLELLLEKHHQKITKLEFEQARKNQKEGGGRR